MRMKRAPQFFMAHMVDRKSLLGSTWKCDCGQTHSVPVRQVIVEHGAISNLAAIVKDAGNVKSALVISDANTRKIAGEKIAGMLKSCDFVARELVIPGEKPVADDVTADWVVSKVRDEEILISCGSGTVTDLTKYSSFQKKRPFIAVATAPSMNGYASGIVALTEKGLKKTIPVVPALAVLGDLDILCNAPVDMIRSGLGDVISKPVSMADWKLSSIVKGDFFCPLPYNLIADLESIYTASPQKLPARDSGAIRALMEALVYSGISMIIAGSSAPASGAEHLISHTLDMQASLHGVEHDFHGAQVGVSTIITARLYERLMALDPSKLDWTAIRDHHRAGKAAMIKEYWGALAPSVIGEYDRKWMPWEQKREELARIVEHWDEITDELKVFLRPSSEIERILAAAGAKTHYSDIGSSPQAFGQAILMALSMRSRYTVLDLADDLGLLREFANQMTGEK